MSQSASEKLDSYCKININLYCRPTKHAKLYRNKNGPLHMLQASDKVRLYICHKNRHRKIIGHAHHASI